MDTRFIESLLSVVEKGSIAAAARSQGLTPAAINQRIKALEMELDETLFERAGKTVMPTDACVRLLPHAKRLVADVLLLKAGADETGLTAELKVGMTTTIMVSLIPEVLAALKKSAPGITLDIVPGTSKVLYDFLLQGELDVAILIEPPFGLPKNLQSNILRDEPLMFVGPEGLTLSVAEALEHMPYIRYSPDSWGGLLAEQYLRQQGIVPDVFCTIDDIETSARMVASGMGVSLLPSWCDKEQVASALCWQELGSSEHARRIVSIQRRGIGKEKALSVFEHTLTAVHANISD